MGGGDEEYGPQEEEEVCVGLGVEGWRRRGVKVQCWPPRWMFRLQVVEGCFGRMSQLLCAIYRAHDVMRRTKNH